MRRIILIGLILVVAIAIALAFWSNSKEEASSVAPVTLITRLNSDILGTEPGGSRDENTDTVIMQISCASPSRIDQGFIRRTSISVQVTQRRLLSQWCATDLG